MNILVSSLAILIFSTSALGSKMTSTNEKRNKINGTDKNKNVSEKALAVPPTPSPYSLTNPSPPPG